jgi:hypothetical protein
MSKRDHERDIGRRALIKWSVAAGAALGVSRHIICEILEKTAGKGVALAAGATHNKRSVHIRAGNGGLAWFQLMWPHNAIAAAHNTNFAWHKIGSESMATGTSKPLTIGPDTPFAGFEGNKQITAYMAGSNEQHTDNANSIVRSVASGSLFAIASVLQADTPSVVPVITVDDSDFGTAPGAAQPSNVPTSDDIVGLFNSAASRAGSLLATSQHADLYRAQYATMSALNRASTLSTTRDSYRTSRSAAKFLGTNLSAQLQFTEDAMYGLTGTTFNTITNNPGTNNKRDQVANLAKGLAAAAKAFQLGLATSIVLPSLRDDPHGAFSGPAALSGESQAILTTMQTLLNAFMADLASKHDPVTGESLADGTILTIEGDTPKTPVDTNAWPDNTAQMSNWMFVLGGGALKTGWFGSLTPNGGVDGTANGFDPHTGDTLTGNYDGNIQAQAAVAATVYAITRGDIRRTQDFSRQDITGLIV